MTSMGRIQSLDGWRGIAISLVILAHLMSCGEIRAIVPEDVINTLGGYGMTGVQVFFVISGYVITRGLLADHAAGGISLRAFYVRRACRILPPLWIFLGALALMGFTADLVPAALFLCNTTVQGHECVPVVGHTWSLAFEEQFYLLLPSLLLLWLSARRPPITLLLAAIALASLPLVVPDPGIGARLVFPTYAALFAGVIVAVGDIRIPSRPLWIVIAVIIAAVVPRLHHGASAFVLQTFALPAAIAVLVFGVRGAVVSNAPLAYLGRISYSVYLWQEVATWEVLHVDLTGRLLLMALLFLGTAFSYHTVEAFFRDLGHKYAETIRARRARAGLLDDVAVAPKSLP